MTTRRYYSVRTGKNPKGAKHDLTALKRLFIAHYNDFRERELFQQFLGKDCPDDSDSFGTAGRDIPAFFYRKLWKDGLWPIHEMIATYSEDDLFDVIELLHDHASEGIDGRLHSYGGCGMHYSTFSPEKGRVIFRRELNELLVDYEDGFELSADGEIVHLPAAGFEHLVHAPVPHSDQANVSVRIEAAVAKYRSRSSGLQERRDATRALIDVLEYLRPEVKKVFVSEDENALFNIANNFGIRHHNQKQRTDYDPNVWTSWMFYVYLATVHAALRLLERRDAAGSA